MTAASAGTERATAWRGSLVVVTLAVLFVAGLGACGHSGAAGRAGARSASRPAGTANGGHGPPTTGTASTTTPATTATPATAPPPGSGSTSAPGAPPKSLVTVAPVATVTLPPTPPGQTANFGTGVTVRVSQVQSVNVAYQLPGDVAGPAVSVTLVLTNGGPSAFPANGVAVTATYGNATPASPVLDNGYRPFSGTIGPGATQTGVYPFRVPVADQSTVQVQVAYRSGAPIAVLAA